MPKQILFKPKLGVPYHHKYINSAFKQTVDSLAKDFNFQIEFLDWQAYEEGNVQLILKYTSSIDGLLLPGGHYGRNFKLFGSEETQDSEREFAFKKELTQQALKRGMPILGLCAGTIMLNFMFHGTVTLLAEKKDNSSQVNHDVMPLNGDLAHDIEIIAGTHLHDILSGNRVQKDNIHIEVNSWHHGAIKMMAEKFIVSAYAPDGVIEAIEMKEPGNRNCFGLQFHPEYILAHKNPEVHKVLSRVLGAIWQACEQYHLKHKTHLELLGFFTVNHKKEEQKQPVSDQQVLSKIEYF
jgi:gamma-glutamyl-gamma-aminobutyrate hydrolase PuuD